MKVLVIVFRDFTADPHRIIYSALGSSLLAASGVYGGFDAASDRLPENVSVLFNLGVLACPVG